MKKFINYSLVLLSVLAITAQGVNAQSCDTLRNYNPTDQFYQLTSGTSSFILGHENEISDGTNNYEANNWSETYTVAAATEVRAIRFLPWKVDDVGTIDSIAFYVWGDNAGNPDLGNELGKEWIRYDEMTANQFSLLEFTTPANVNGTFHVGYRIKYNATQDTFALLGTQPATNFTKLQLQNPGAPLDGDWYEVSGVYSDAGGNPVNTAFVLDVLTSTATAPTADFTVTPASGAVCLGTDFLVDGSATTGAVDVYDWYLTDQAVTTIYDNDNTSGVNASLTPTTSPSTQTLILIADGACVSDAIGYLVDVYDAVSATVGTTDPTCGTNNGEIDITAAAGGDGTYTYEITDGGGNTTSQTTGTFSSLAPGTYDVVVSTAGGGCEFTQTVTLSNIPAETVTAAGDEVICNGSSVNLTATGTGSIEWFDGGGNSVGTGSPVSVSPTTTTTYDAVLTDANGCTDTDQLQVTVKPVNDASFSYSSNTICLTGSNQTPTINGTGTFTSTPTGLVFADASTGEIDIANSTADTYDVTFTTTGTCGETETQAITLTSSPDASFSYSATEFCAEVGTETPTFPTGASAGTFTATPTGLSLNGSNGEITLDASSADTYTITNTIAASGSCPQATATATVTINALPTVNAGADDAVCEGTQVTLTATGADSYVWTGGITQGTAFTPAVGANTYTVTGTDANNCENTDDVTITVDEEPVVDAGADQEVCEGNEVTLTATTSVGTVSWDNGITDGTAFTPTATTTYTATATNGSCSVTDDVIVTVNTLPTVTTGADETTCENYDPITLTGNPSGGVFTGNGVTGNQFDPGTAGVGTHVVTYTYQDANGCENTATQEFTVDGCASIEENSLDAIVVAPNPATSFVEVTLNKQDLESVQLVSATGQVINTTITVNTTKTRIELDSVAKGTYFLQINTTNGQTTKKLIVQ